MKNEAHHYTFVQIAQYMLEGDLRHPLGRSFSVVTCLGCSLHAVTSDLLPTEYLALSKIPTLADIRRHRQAGLLMTSPGKHTEQISRVL